MKINIKKNVGNLDINIETNEDFIGILGKSGAGKSMLLKCICGVETPDFGEIIVGGITLFSSEKGVNLKPQERNVGYLFQNYALFDNLTVEENVKVVNSRCDFEHITRICKLTQLLKRKPTQLSGGQKQRVAIARILASNAQLILLDEPFSALDFHTKNELEQELFDTLKSQNKRYILVSHNHNEIYRNTTQVGIIDNGKIIDFGSDVFEKPRNESSAKLVGFDNVLHENCEKIFFRSSDVTFNKNGKYSGVVTKISKNLGKNDVFALINEQEIKVESKNAHKIGETICFDIVNAHKIKNRL